MRARSASISLQSAARSSLNLGSAVSIQPRSAASEPYSFATTSSPLMAVGTRTWTICRVSASLAVTRQIVVPTAPARIRQRAAKPMISRSRIRRLAMRSRMVVSSF